MDVTEAAQVAKKHLATVFSGESISDVYLEEVEFDDSSDNWKITIGFNRLKPFRNPLAAKLEVPDSRRCYKIVRIRGNGDMVSIKDRFFAASG